MASPARAVYVSAAKIYLEVIEDYTGTTGD
jgi:hypothetical protein